LNCGSSPRTTRAYISAIATVASPGQGTRRSSTELTELTSAAVPQTKISSAMYRSLRAMLSRRQS
jgi:hypothetical protein